MKRELVFHKRGSVIGGLSLTNKLILVNVLAYIFILFVIGIYGEEFFLNNIALTPSLILSGENLWTFITSMFSHVLFFHLFANMFSLFFVGNFLERIIGRRRFLSVYLAAGILGGVFFVGLAYIGQLIPYGSILFGGIDINGVGASGAIFGLLGVLAVLVPYSRIYLIVGPLIVLILVLLFPQFSLIGNILILIMIFSMFSFNSRLRILAVPIEMPMWVLPFVAIIPLVLISFYIPLPIGNSAHFGGLVVGLAYGFYLRRKFPRKTDLLRKHFR